jgi:carbon monoxide dehydrogenase subunit G
MEMMGEQIIPLPQSAVWDALNDPDILRQCIPGCDSVEKIADNEYRISMVAAVGPVKAKFTGKLTIVDPQPPNAYGLAFEGSGGVAGFGKGTAEVMLTQESDTVTCLAYKATATVGGKLAQIGSRLIDGVARKMADGFFTKFTAAATAASAPVATEETTGAGPVAMAPAESPKRRGWFGLGSRDDTPGDA